MKEEEDFKNQFRVSLMRQFVKLFTPKLPDAHVSRIVMYEAMNASASTGYHIEKMIIHRKRETGDLVRVQINETILIDFNIQHPTEENND